VRVPRVTAATFAVIGIATIVAILITANLVGFELNALFAAAPGSDKVVHFATYAVAFVCIFTLASRFTRSVTTQVAIAAGAGLLLSVGDELLQELAPGRNVEFYDLIADWAGMTIGWVFVVRPARAVAAAATAIALAAGGFVAADTYNRLIDYSRALRAERKQDFATARIHYLRAVDNGLRTAAVYNELAWVSVEAGAGSPEESVAYARKAFAMEPGNPDILDTLGWALQNAGRSEEALPYLTRAYAMKPSMFCIHYHLGQAYLSLGRTALAERHFREQMVQTGTREAGLAAAALERAKAQSGTGDSSK
jgi:tetratricopeptide (TPR) repeat protein